MPSGAEKAVNTAGVGVAGPTPAPRRAAASRRGFWLKPAVLLLLLSAGGVAVRDKVEQRRYEAKLTWASPEAGGQDTLEAGFAVLGGFRGLLADILWLRAQTEQDAGRFYELTMLCDLILKLEPTFTGVHAFLAYNMCYMLASDMQTTEDEWYWVRNGLETLEKGLRRNEKSSALWWELGLVYYVRLSLTRLKGRFDRMWKLIPAYDEVEGRLPYVFTGEGEARAGKSKAERKLRRPRRREKRWMKRLDYFRYAKYYFQQALKCGDDPLPRRTRRCVVHCMEGLGEWAQAEKAWYELWRECLADGSLEEAKVMRQNLRFLLLHWLDREERAAGRATQRGDTETAKKKRAAAENIFRRLRKYFPDEQHSKEELLRRHRAFRARRDPDAYTVIDAHDQAQRATDKKSPEKK